MTHNHVSTDTPSAHPWQLIDSHEIQNNGERVVSLLKYNPLEDGRWQASVSVGDKTSTSDWASVSRFSPLDGDLIAARHATYLLACAMGCGMVADALLPQSLTPKEPRLRAA